MLKFFIILFILIYVFARFSGFFIRAAFVLFGQEERKKTFYRNQDANYKQKHEGDVTILIPEKKSKSSEENEGEYVDFEEVKDK